MGRGPISRHRSFDPYVMRRCGLIWFYSRFPEAIPFREVGCPRVTHPFATFFLSFPPEGFYSRFLVRLACVKHTASVRPEPGSNSQLKVYLLFALRELKFQLIFSFLSRSDASTPASDFCRNFWFFQVLWYVSILFSMTSPAGADNFFMIISISHFVKRFFDFFSNLF